MSTLNVCTDFGLTWLDFPDLSPGTRDRSSAQSSPFTVHKAFDMLCNILWMPPCHQKKNSNYWRRLLGPSCLKIKINDVKIGIKFELRKGVFTCCQATFIPHKEKFYIM